MKEHGYPGVLGVPVLNLVVQVKRARQDLTQGVEGLVLELHLSQLAVKVNQLHKKCHKYAY